MTRVCFGVPSVYHPDSEECHGRCPTLERCRKQCKRRLLALGDAAPAGLLARFADVDESPEANLELTEQLAERNRQKAMRVSPSDDQERQLAALPKKVAESVRTMIRRGFDEKARQTMKEGGNPFSMQRNKALYLVVAMLLSGALIVTRPLIREAFVRKFKWSAGAASSEATRAVQILIALGLAQEKSGVLVSSPRSEREDTSKKHKGKQ